MTPTLLLLLAAAAAPLAVVDARVEIGDGTVLEKATIVLDESGRIAAVGPDVKAPSGARVVDGRGKVVTPGLFEPVSQMGLVEVLLEGATDDQRVGGQAVTPAFRAADGFNPLSVRIPIEREEGITSTVIAPRGGLIRGTGHLVEMTGKLSSRPDPVKPLAMFGALGRAAAGETGGSRGAALLRLREILADVRFYERNKARIDAGAARELSLSPLHLEALIPVVQGRMPLVLEADRASDLLDAVALARDEGLRVVIVGGAEGWLVADELARARIPVVFTASVQGPGSFDTLRGREDGAALMQKAGVDVAFTSGCCDQNLRRLRQEAGIATSFGFPRAQALRAVTLTPARIYGVDGERGSIAKGKRGDLVVWSGDPLEVSTIAEKVFIGGEEQPMDNRQRRLVEKYLGR